MRRLFVAICSGICALPSVVAHETLTPVDYGLAQATGAANPLLYLSIASLVLVSTLLVSFFASETWTKRHGQKLFLLIACSIGFATVLTASFSLIQTLSADTIAIGTVEYQLWDCGKRITIPEPAGLTTTTGVPQIHDHDGNRIHLVGMTATPLTLGAFFDTIGGELTSDHVILPTATDYIHRTTMDSCPDGRPGVLQVFVNGKRMDNAAAYVLHPGPAIPPGDCIIIDFNPTVQLTTEKTCDSMTQQQLHYGDAYGT